MPSLPECASLWPRIRFSIIHHLPVLLSDLLRLWRSFVFLLSFFCELVWVSSSSEHCFAVWCGIQCSELAVNTFKGFNNILFHQTKPGLHPWSISLYFSSFVTVNRAVTFLHLLLLCWSSGWVWKKSGWMYLIGSCDWPHTLAYWPIPVLLHNLISLFGGRSTLNQEPKCSSRLASWTHHSL